MNGSFGRGPCPRLGSWGPPRRSSGRAGSALLLGERRCGAPLNWVVGPHGFAIPINKCRRAREAGAKALDLAWWDSESWHLLREVAADPMGSAIVIRGASYGSAVAGWRFAPRSVAPRAQSARPFNWGVVVSGRDSVRLLCLPGRFGGPNSGESCALAAARNVACGIASWRPVAALNGCLGCGSCPRMRGWGPTRRSSGRAGSALLYGKRGCGAPLNLDVGPHGSRFR